jgi:hypothetical protein
LTLRETWQVKRKKKRKKKKKSQQRTVKKQKERMRIEQKRKQQKIPLMKPVHIQVSREKDEACAGMGGYPSPIDFDFPNRFFTSFLGKFL